MGQLENGALLTAAAQAGFEVMITADKNIRHQQVLAGRASAVVVLGTNHWRTIREKVHLVEEAIRLSKAGRAVDVEFD